MTWVHHSLFTHSYTEGNLTCFQIQMIMSTAVINIQVHVYVWAYIFIFGGKYLRSNQGKYKRTEWAPKNKGAAKQSKGPMCSAWVPQQFMEGILPVQSCPEPQDGYISVPLWAGDTIEARRKRLHASGGEEEGSVGQPVVCTMEQGLTFPFLWNLEQGVLSQRTMLIVLSWISFKEHFCVQSACNCHVDLTQWCYSCSPTV